VGQIGLTNALFDSEITLRIAIKPEIRSPNTFSNYCSNTWLLGFQLKIKKVLESQLKTKKDGYQTELA
jgi:hypothetical protein